MSSSPVICFGQQPCGFFPRRYLFAKIRTALRLQRKLGGQIVFFYHDADHDPRETRTCLRHRKTNEAAYLNFSVENKVQRKFSPLFLKRISTDWSDKTALQLPNYVDRRLIDIFKGIDATCVADFCLEMYRGLGLLEGIRIARSGDPAFRRAACEVSDFFVDVPYEGEIVRARYEAGALRLHQGGDAFITLPETTFTKEQITPARDTRLRWMQSVLNCTHYIAGAGEQAYLRPEEAPEIEFVGRDTIDRHNDAYTESPT